MKKGIIVSIVVAALVVSLFPLASAGFFDFLKRSPTGRAASSPLDLNISVTSDAPWIYNVSEAPAITLSVGPNPTYFHINFSVNDSDGATNLNNNSAAVNITASGETTRVNSSCAVTDYGGNHANFSCLMTVWWFDGNDNWAIGVNVSDINSNVGSNTTDTQTINILDGFEMYPSSLTFSTLTPGLSNQTPTNYLIMNNTGNQNYVSTDVEVNATDLTGETTPGQALYAANFSASPQTGGNIECNVSASATALVNDTSTGIANIVINKGNYTIDDGTAQEDMYFCLREIGTDLSEQYYSTDLHGTWTVRVT